MNSSNTSISGLFTDFSPSVKNHSLFWCLRSKIRTAILILSVMGASWGWKLIPESIIKMQRYRSCFFSTWNKNLLSLRLMIEDPPFYRLLPQTGCFIEYSSYNEVAFNWSVYRPICTSTHRSHVHQEFVHFLDFCSSTACVIPPKAFRKLYTSHKYHASINFSDCNYVSLLDVSIKIALVAVKSLRMHQYVLYRAIERRIIILFDIRNFRRTSRREFWAPVLATIRVLHAIIHPVSEHNKGMYCTNHSSKTHLETFSKMIHWTWTGSCCSDTRLYQLITMIRHNT